MKAVVVPDLVDPLLTPTIGQYSDIYVVAPWVLYSHKLGIGHCPARFWVLKEGQQRAMGVGWLISKSTDFRVTYHYRNVMLKRDKVVVWGNVLE